MERLIWNALWRFERHRLELAIRKGWGEDLAAEVRAAAFQASSPKEAFKAANAIRRHFLDAILPRWWDEEEEPWRAELPRADRLRLASIETAYKAGGAQLVRALFPCRGERYKREIEKLLSMCFRHARNELRNSDLRKRVQKLLEEGYRPRITREGSLYLERDGRKIRISDHAADGEWFVYADIEEDIVHSNF